MISKIVWSNNLDATWKWKNKKFIFKTTKTGLVNQNHVSISIYIFGVGQLPNLHEKYNYFSFLIGNLIYQCRSSFHFTIYMEPIQASNYQEIHLSIYVHARTSVICKELSWKIIHNSKLHILRWFPMTLSLIYKPVVYLLLI